MHKTFLSIAFVIIISTTFGQSGVKQLNLKQVIDLALEQSPDAVLAKHRFRSSYWEYRSYRSSMLPSLTLNSDVLNMNNSISSITQPDGSEVYQRVQKNNSSLGLTLNQNVGFTGGNFFVYSGLARTDDFRVDSLPTSYMSTPLSIGYSQPAFQFNPYKWQKKIEPLKYEEAKREYIFRLEIISERAVDYFYNLALAQLNVEITESNFHNNDTIYKIAQGRYNIGTIAENELLQIELAYLNSKSSLAQAKINLEIAQFRLRSFLGFNNLVEIRLEIDKTVPLFEVPLDKALDMARLNSGDLIALERRLYEAQRDVARAKAENRFNANFYAALGLNQAAPVIDQAYKDPNNRQQFTVGVEIPLIDWGEGKGRLRMAQSNEEVVRTQVKQERIDFEQNVLLKIMQFNEQDNQLLITAKADTIARKRYEVAKQRFLIGKIDVLDLNVASTEKDEALRNYLRAQKTFWTYYYNIRQLTLYDFINDASIGADFENLEY